MFGGVRKYGGTVLGLALGLFFLATGLKKIAGWPWALQSYLQHFPSWVYYAGAIGEIAFGLGMLIPKFRFYAAVGLLCEIALLSIHGTNVPGVIASTLILGLAFLDRPRRLRFGACQRG
jgi:uncharacterized membrane protein YphA (DoxX/SURF4 family)